MTCHHQIRKGVVGALAWVLLVSAACLPQAAAGEIDETSLGFVPADVSFYYSMQNNREVYDRVVESKAFARVQQSALWQLGMFAWQMQAENPEGEIGKFMEEMNKPENVELRELAIDMASDEIFYYGDANWAKLYGMYNELYRTAWSQAIEDFSTGSIDFENPSPEQQQEFNEKIFRSALKLLDEAEFPTLVSGFKIRDMARAKRQIERLEEFLRAAGPPDNVKISGFGWKEIGSGEYLTVRVHGFVVSEDDLDPEDQLPPELVKQMAKKLENLEFSVAIGIDRGYVLMSIGPDNGHLASLGEGDLLLNEPEFAPLREAGERTFTHISYANRELIEETHFGPKSVESWTEFIKAYLASEEAELDTEVKEMWLAGIDEVADGIKEWFHERGPRMSFSWLSGRGFEGYRYNWDENISYNGEERLSVLDHVGGDPIFFWITRRQYRPESWDPLFKLGYLIVDTVEQASAEQLDDEDLVKLQRWLEEGRPLLGRAVKLYREQYSAGLADGQSAWVFDAKLAKRQWTEDMPPADVPLPVPEFATVQGVSDAEKIKTAARDGLELIHEAQELVQELAEGEEIPIEEVPTPVHTTTDQGDFLQFPSPSELEFPEEFVTTYGLSEKAFVSTSTLDHAQRLLKPTPLKVEGPIAARDGPAFDATYFSWTRLLDKTTPWLDYASQQLAAKAEAAEDDPEEEIEEIDPLDGVVPEIDEAALAQIRSTIELLRFFDQYSSVSYLEDEAQVTHYEWRFQDLEE